MKVIVKAICVLLMVPMFALAHDMSLHMKLAAETFDVWQDFDPAFYQRMITPAESLRDSILKMKTYKFYYIGAILPDLFWPHAQSSIRTLINTLYEERDNLTDPLYIITGTKDDVQAPFEFPAGTNSHNLEKLYQMVNYARDNNWSAYEKSMIYGAYLHAVHDMYASFMQASRFGYGRCYDSDSALHHDILGFAELYHELFSQTHMQGSWVNFFSPLYCEVADPNGMAKLRYGSCCFYREYTTDGSYFLGWQQLYFTPIQKYIEASNAVGWQVANLSHDRLRSYLHGFAIATFMLYGYKRDGSCAGGVFSHPDWSIDYLVDEFWYDIGSYYYEPWYLGILPNVVQDWLKRTAWENMGIKEWLKQAYGSYPWPQYLEDFDKLEELWNGIPDSLKTPEAYLEYRRARANLESWQTTPSNHILEPRLRNTYSTEASLALDFRDLCKTSINQGPSDLSLEWNGLDVWTTARKAGLLGGLYDIPSALYSRQPGIIDLHYYAKVNDEREHFYTPLITEDMPYGGIEWDMIIFPQKANIRLMGKKLDSSVFQIESFEYNVNDVERKQSYLEVNLDSAVLEGAEEIYWEILTYNPEHNSCLMLKADYRDAYQPVSGYALYQLWFNYGDPTRNEQQNPLTNPLKYWPSVLRVYGLHKPQSITHSYISSTQEKLQWTDKSNRESGFQIARKKDDQQWNMDYALVRGAPGSGAMVEYIDTVTLCHKYVYKTRAYDTEGRYSDWSEEIINIHGSLAQSDYLKMSAFNSNRKVVCNTDGKIHMIYYDGYLIYYAYSTDHGLSFSSWEYVSEIDTTRLSHTNPTLALDGEGIPYVVYGINAQIGGYRRIRYYVGRRTESGWTFTYHPIFSSVPTNETTLPCSPSLTITEDSGYVAFRDNVDGIIKVSAFGLPLSANPNNDPISPNGLSPAIGYDEAGRIVVAVHEGACGPLKVHYRSLGSDEWSSVHIEEFPFDAAFGAPSLWAEIDTLYITAEGFDNNDPAVYYCCLKWGDAHEKIYDDPSEPLQGLKPDIEPAEPEKGGPIYIPGSAYKVQSVEKVGMSDYDIDGILGYSFLASKDVVLWKHDDDIVFARKTDECWSYQLNLSNTTYISSFPQGVMVTNDNVLAVWTEKIDDEYYLIRDIVTSDGPPAPAGSGPQATSEMTVGTFYFENIYPNPTTRGMKIRFCSPDERHVMVKIYDITGRLVEKVFDDKAKVGVNDIVVGSEDWVSGVYFVHLFAQGCEKVDKITFLR